ncbi:hypothetical protein [Streptomyces hiroshimensis]|uniref:Uncharacterized protein n=1 Tax=Streptomyces hiroshimensis TaxID=66424 RepID=A0ABQ2ZCF8_9ACTN|nr:hypothetical protein [Streptomyces hiroshimensis]GGY12029.1 hypothetical protein GCM10010324_68420 [Streptomyces hiroshimensis]
MRRMNFVLAAAVMAGLWAAPAAVAEPPSAPPSAVHAPAAKPPFSYEDCLKAAKKHGESARYSRWHCDQLVKKGWVRLPKR